MNLSYALLRQYVAVHSSNCDPAILCRGCSKETQTLWEKPDLSTKHAQIGTPLLWNLSPVFPYSWILGQDA